MDPDPGNDILNATPQVFSKRLICQREIRAGEEKGLHSSSQDELKSLYQEFDNRDKPVVEKDRPYVLCT
jgi:hypothetical protein